MSNYCTNCKWLGKETNAGRTQWLCKKERAVGYMLQSLCGNQTKLLQCINENWYELKQKENKMNRTKEMIEVMQAYLDGKTVQQSSTIPNNKEWYDANNPIWNWYQFNYRIKPEPKYRELNDNEMKLLVGKVIVEKSSGNVLLVACAKQELYEVKIHTTQSWFTSSFLLKHFTYTDGTPVGVLEEV